MAGVEDYWGVKQIQRVEHIVMSIYADVIESRLQILADADMDSEEYHEVYQFLSDIERLQKVLMDSVELEFKKRTIGGEVFTERDECQAEWLVMGLINTMETL